MQKHFFVLSDIEMGQGDVMDDFSDDHAFVNFIEHLLAKNLQGEVNLILNGDIFDFLKMPFQGEHLRYVTEKISLWKMERIFDTHPTVFEAMRRFLSGPDHSIYFLIGNHDFDLVWPKVQAKILQHLAPKSVHAPRIHFEFKFDYEDFHAEHGNRLDPFFCVNVKRPIVTFKGMQILNMPVGCYVFFSHLAPFKRKFAKEEQLYPRSRIPDYHEDYGLEMGKIKWAYFWRGLLEPWIHFNDPTYRVNYFPFIKHFLRFGLNFTDDERFLPSRVNYMIYKFPRTRVFMLGHCHLYRDISHRGRRFLITDTWRDEFNLLAPGRPKKQKSYAEVVYSGKFLHHADLHIFESDQLERTHQTLERSEIARKNRKVLQGVKNNLVP